MSILILSKLLQIETKQILFLHSSTAHPAQLNIVNDQFPDMYLKYSLLYINLSEIEDFHALINLDPS